MAKSKHHYVPRLYLNAFASAPKRINVAHIATRHVYSDVSLRDQGSRNRFYGQTDELEDSLAALESTAAPILTTIISSQSLAMIGSEQRRILLEFIALQAVRTVKAAEDLRVGGQDVVASIDEVFGDVPAGFDAVYTMSTEEVVKRSIGLARGIGRCLADLGWCLIRSAPPQGFITSDNPTIRYNAYCEGILDEGVTGVAMCGFQLFLPLSPRLTLLLFDRYVYKVTGIDRDGCCTADGRDVGQLNLLQAVHADKVLLYAELPPHADVLRAISKAHPLRLAFAPRVTVSPTNHAGASGSIVQLFQSPVDIGLRLSFLRLRTKPGRTPLKSRVAVYRRGLEALVASGPHSA